MKKSISALCILASTVIMAATYPSAGNGTEPNVWTRNYSGVLAAAEATGYPVFLIVVNSAGCTHCAEMMDRTVYSSEFKQMESELTFYKVIMDQAYSGTSSDYRTCIRRYSAYFNNDMYPAVVVLRKDGSAYGGFGNRVTDKRNVTPDIRKMIETLAVEQGAAGAGGYVPATDTDPAPVVSVSAWASKLKGKANGLLFDANQDVAGSFIMKINAKGVVTAKISVASGTKTLHGKLEAANDSVRAAGGDMALDYNTSSKTWTGSLKGLSAFSGVAYSTASDGLYTAGAESGERSGYLTLTLKRGKGKIAGYLGGNKIAVASSDYDIKVSANVRQGTFKGSCRVNGSKLTIVGALVKNGTGITGVGVTYGGGVYHVSIGSPCGSDCTM